MANKLLHRVDEKYDSDWEQDLAEGKELTPVQQRAMDTHGIDTPANRETMKGLGEGTLGAMAFATGPGLMANVVGGILTAKAYWRDRRDGKIADEERVKSKFGKRLDAGIDKVKMGETLAGAWAGDIMPKSEIGALGVVNAVNISVSVKGELIDGKNMNSSIFNKVGYGMQPVAIGAHVVGNVVSTFSPEKGKQVKKVATALTVGAVAVSTIGTASLIQQYRQQRPQEEEPVLEPEQ